MSLGPLFHIRNYCKPYISFSSKVLWRGQRKFLGRRNGPNGKKASTTRSLFFCCPVNSNFRHEIDFCFGNEIAIFGSPKLFQTLMLSWFAVEVKNFLSFFFFGRFPFVFLGTSLTLLLIRKTVTELGSGKIRFDHRIPRRVFLPTYSADVGQRSRTQTRDVDGPRAREMCALPGAKCTFE